MRWSQPTRIGWPLALVVSWIVLMLILPAAARAGDLLLLNGDSITLSGAHQYGFVYVDGDMRLSGDTSISASSIYIGPNAYVPTCYVPGSGDNACTAGRSLTLNATGKLTVSSRIDLTGGTGSPQPGGNLNLRGNPVTVGGDITTAGANGGASGQVNISSGGSLGTGGIYAPGAPVALAAQGGIDVGGDIYTYGNNSTAQTDPTRVQSAAPVTVASNAGDVRIDGNVYAGGRDAPSAGAPNGGNGAPAPITITARDALHALGRLDSSGQNSAAGNPTPGNRISLGAGGPLIAAGGVNVDGATGPAGGSPAGAITVNRVGVTAGDLTERRLNSLTNVLARSASGPL